MSNRDFFASSTTTTTDPAHSNTSLIQTKSVPATEFIAALMITFVSFTTALMVIVVLERTVWQSRWCRSRRIRFNQGRWVHNRVSINPWDEDGGCPPRYDVALTHASPSREVHDVIMGNTSSTSVFVSPAGSRWNRSTSNTNVNNNANNNGNNNVNTNVSNGFQDFVQSFSTPVPGPMSYTGALTSTIIHSTVTTSTAEEIITISDVIVDEHVDEWDIRPPQTPHFEPPPYTLTRFPF